MRLSLRLVAERSGRPDALGDYLDDPLLLFVPVRLLLGLVTASATALLARAIRRRRRQHADVRRSSARRRRSWSSASCCCRSRIVGRDPERVLELLLPSFAPVARALGPITQVDRAHCVQHEAAGDAGQADEAEAGGERGRQGVPRRRRAGRDHRRRGAEAPAEHRRLRRHARPRGDDAAARHRGHSRRRDDRRSARAVPRAGVLAVSRSTRRASTTSPASCS